jgi:hypothetical protein
MVDAVGAVANIIQAPQSVTTPANERVTFSVNAEASSPYNYPVVYQWFRNGVAIPGANATSYTLPIVTAADTGARFTVTVAVPGKSTNSTEALLTVNPDNKPPTIVRAEGSDAFNSVLLTFSEPVTGPSATTTANYTLNGGVTVSAAQFVNTNTVRLTTSAQSPNTPYTVTVANVADIANNAVAANTTANFTSFAQRPGEARALFYTGIGGTALSALRASPKFPNQPDDIRFLTSLSSPDGYGENYGVMLRGYIAPTNSGSYHFFIRSDDASALYLNTSGETPPDPLTATPIAEETGCCAAFMEPGDPRTTANPIALQAGQRYGFTILMKEGGGGDYVQVAWRPETDTTAAAQLQPIGAAFIGTYGPPAAVTGPTLSLARTATGITLTFEGTLESADSVTGPWTAVQGASPQNITTSTGTKFFRARR